MASPYLLPSLPCIAPSQLTGGYLFTHRPHTFFTPTCSLPFPPLADVRTSSVAYDPNNLDDRSIHLVNDAVQCQVPVTHPRHTSPVHLHCLTSIPSSLCTRTHASFTPSYPPALLPSLPPTQYPETYGRYEDANKLSLLDLQQELDAQPLAE